VKLTATPADADQHQPLTMSAKRITVDLAHNHFIIGASEEATEVAPMPRRAAAVTASKP